MNSTALWFPPFFDPWPMSMTAVLPGSAPLRLSIVPITPLMCGSVPKGLAILILTLLPSTSMEPNLSPSSSPIFFGTIFSEKKLDAKKSGITTISSVFPLTRKLNVSFTSASLQSL